MAGRRGIGRATSILARTGGIAFMGSAVCATAQEVSAEASKEGGLETIIVTAQKRAENIQVVPISIAAVTGDAVEATHVVNLEAISGRIPNVQVGHFANNPHSAVFNIRGMGVIEPDPYAGQTVTVVLDGVPQFFNMTSLPSLFDIDRIEVLRGPQGTLFGANTTGGVVNIVTRQPTGEVEGDAEVTIGDWNRLDANAAFNFPLIPDVLAGKLSVLHHSQDGWTKNVVDGTTMGDQEITAVRGYLDWTVNDGVGVSLIGEYVRGRGGGPIVIQGAYPGEAQYTPEGTYVTGDYAPMYANPCLPVGKPCHAPDDYRGANSSVPDSAISDQWAGTLTVDWSTGIGDFVSITGYRDFTEDNWTDQDGTPLFYDDTHRVTDGYQFTQELRDTIDFSDSIQLLVGGFYSFDHYDHSQNFRIQFAAPGFRQLSTQDQDRESMSIFAQTYIDLTDRLRLQVGVRGTHEETEMVATVENFISPTGEAVFQGDDPLGVPFIVQGDESWDNIGGKLGLDFQVNDDVMLYGYYARGFKSGGFTGRAPIVPSDIGPYDPEYVDSYEVGIKADWFDNRLRTNLAGFFNDYQDLQLSQIYFTEDANGNVVNGNTIVNAATAETKGFELEVIFVPVEAFEIDLAVGYLDATYKDFPYNDPNQGGALIDMAGEKLQNAPEWTATGGIRYDFGIGDGNVSLGVRGRYTDEKFVGNLTNSPRSQIQSTTFVDANIDWTPTADGNLSLSLWARNLGDKRYIAGVYDGVGVIGLINYDAPREYGVTVQYGWGH